MQMLIATLPFQLTLFFNFFQMDTNYRKFFMKLTLDGDNNKVIEASDCNVAFIMKAPVTVLYRKQASKKA